MLFFKCRISARIECLEKGAPLQWKPQDRIIRLFRAARLESWSAFTFVRYQLLTCQYTRKTGTGVKPSFLVCSQRKLTKIMGHNSKPNVIWELQLLTLHIELTVEWVSSRFSYSEVPVLKCQYSRQVIFTHGSCDFLSLCRKNGIII